MKIFGIGLNKTGTTTLGVCLKSMGYRHLTCRRDLLIAYREGRIEEVFAEIDKYDSFEDWPYPLMYAELFERYEDAKFILTVRRDAETWLRSLKKHSLNTDPKIHSRKYAFGYNYPFGHEEYHLAFYEKHNADVIEFFQKHNATDRLLTLCWENGDGWPELATFLGYEDLDQKVPRINPAKKISWKNTRQLKNRWRAGYWGKI